MKKILCLLLGLLLMCSFTACGFGPVEGDADDAGDPRVIEEGPYSTMMIDWPIYDSTRKLLAAADLVFIGKVRNIEFQILDLTTDLPPTESTPEHYRRLNTIYTVEVLDAYKGGATDTVKVRVLGGMVGYEVETQLQMLKEGGTYGSGDYIPVHKHYRRTQGEIGGSYLFVLKEFETGFATILNGDQSIYELKHPEWKRTIGGKNYPSPNDIISACGSLRAFKKNWKAGAFEAE